MGSGGFLLEGYRGDSQHHNTAKCHMGMKAMIANQTGRLQALSVVHLENWQSLISRRGKRLSYMGGVARQASLSKRDAAPPVWTW